MLYADGITDNTLQLQEMLDKRGIVTVDRPGTYIISKTLIIRSDTRLILSPGARILAAPMSRCSLIENEHFAGGGTDERIEIVGGIWDGNCDNMGLDAVYEAKHREDEPYSPKLFKGKMMRFAHVNNIVLEKMTVKDPVSYGIQIASVRGFVVRDLFFDYNHHFGTTDGVHINGPARDGVIENVCGTTNDDMVSLTTIDEKHAEISYGHIMNVDIRNVSAENGYSGIRLQSNAGYEIRNVRISGVYGDYRHNAVLISQHNSRPGTPTWFDDITVEHVRAVKTEKPLPEDCFTYWERGAIEKLAIVWIEKGIAAGNIILRDITRHECTVTSAPLVKIDEGAVIAHLVAENIHQTCAEGVNAPCFKNEGSIAVSVIRNVQE